MIRHFLTDPSANRVASVILISGTVAVVLWEGVIRPTLRGIAILWARRQSRLKMLRRIHSPLPIARRRWIQ